MKQMAITNSSTDRIYFDAGGPVVLDSTMLPPLPACRAVEWANFRTCVI